MFRKTAIFSFAFILLLLATGCSKTDSHSGQAVAAREEIEHGRKLILIMGCNDCHTSGAISGGYGPEEGWLIGSKRGFNGPYGTLYPANLRLLIYEISEDEWVTLAQKMRKNSPMAWSRLPYLSNEDMRAIYNYIKHLGPKGEPAPQRLPPGAKPNTEFLVFPLPH